MRKSVLFAIMIIAIFTNSVAQSTIKVGMTAPEINITDYIHNGNKNVTLKNKYILLEFWATWCAPCLGAVPHLNELATKYKNRKDLLILSMTNEAPTKALKTLERIEFKTMVVSDQTEKTHTNFCVESIPKTVLIDNKGIVKWIGNPMELTDSLFNIFVNGGNLCTKTQEPIVVTEQKSASVSQPQRTWDIFSQLFKNKQLQYLFYLEQANGGGNAISTSPSYNYVMYEKIKLKVILSNFRNSSELQIVIADSLKNKKYNLFYHNRTETNKDLCLNDLRVNLLKTLKMNEKIEERLTDVYILNTTDTSKLELTENYKGITHVGSNDTHLTFSNATITMLINNIEPNLNIRIIDETNLHYRYNFLINITSISNLQKDLALYGLKLEKQQRKMTYYLYN